MLILIDQDGPLADFETGFLDTWREKYPEEFYISVAQRTDFYIREQYPEEFRQQVDEIYNAAGFYRNLPPTPGCIQALNDMIELGLDVRICTAPLSRYENCVLEKYQWVEQHLGREFTRRMILTKDKTIVRGNYLIDDKPLIEGSHIPEWEHIVFDCPYNRDGIKNRRLDWGNWREILSIT
jgi:5'-nucleotidase